MKTYDFEEIKAKTDSKSVAEMMGAKIKGNRCAAVWRGGDGDQNVSFTDDGAWYDHVTGKGGGVLELAAEQFGGDLQQGQEWLGEKLGLAEKSADPGRWETVDIYDYRDENGMLLYRVKRNEHTRERKDGKPKKKIIQVGPDGSAGITGIRRVLWNLPEVLKSQTVFVTEGEKAAKVLTDQGLCATTVSGGSSNWDDSYADFFEGKDVIVLPDNDTPGQEYGQKICAACFAKGIKVKSITLSKEHKGDAWEYFNKEGGTLDGFIQAVLDAPFYDPHEASPEAKHIAKQNPATALLDLQTPVYGNDPNEIIKHRFLYRGGICIMSGATGAGKSSFTMQWAINFAAGKEHFGLKVGDCYYLKGMRVLVIQAENDEGDLAEQRDGVLHVIPPEDIQRAAHNLKFVTMPDACGEGFAIKLDALCQVHRPDLVFIDPVFAFLGGDNSAQKDVSHFVRNLMLPVFMRHRCAAVMMHHVNKPVKDAVKMGAYAMSGSAEWANAARCALSLEMVADGVFRLDATKRGDRLWWQDSQGFKTKTRFIAHHGGHTEDGRPIIAWRDAEPEEIPAQDDGSNTRKKVKAKDVLDALEGVSGGIGSSDLRLKVAQSTGGSERSAKGAIAEALELGLITSLKLGKNIIYSKA